MFAKNPVMTSHTSERNCGILLKNPVIAFQTVERMFNAASPNLFKAALMESQCLTHATIIPISKPIATTIPNTIQPIGEATNTAFKNPIAVEKADVAADAIPAPTAYIFIPTLAATAAPPCASMATVVPHKTALCAT